MLNEAHPTAYNKVREISDIIDLEYPEEWLLRFDLLQITYNVKGRNHHLYNHLKHQIINISKKNPDLLRSIDRGIKIIEKD